MLYRPEMCIKIWTENYPTSKYNNQDIPTWSWSETENRYTIPPCERQYKNVFFFPKRHLISHITRPKYAVTSYKIQQGQEHTLFQQPEVNIVDVTGGVPWLVKKTPTFYGNQGLSHSQESNTCPCARLSPSSPIQLLEGNFILSSNLSSSHIPHAPLVPSQSLHVTMDSGVRQMGQVAQCNIRNSIHLHTVNQQNKRAFSVLKIWH
jgi:hypothetical protein